MRYTNSHTRTYIRKHTLFGGTDAHDAHVYMHAPPSAHQGVDVARAAAFHLDRGDERLDARMPLQEVCFVSLRVCGVCERAYDVNYKSVPTSTNPAGANIIIIINMTYR